MATEVPPAPSERPGRGRPARISRASIAEAAHELGLDGLTLRAVADHLQVSISALYHHVASKDDLMRLAAEYTATRAPRPEDHGQHWAEWLAEWAVYNREAFLSHPGLLEQYLDGAISAEAIAGNVDTILGVLVRQGFTVLEANAAYELVSCCALGTAVATIREQEAARSGQSHSEATQKVVDEAGPDALPYLRRLLREIPSHGRDPFAVQIATVIYGIAVRRNEDWHPLQTLLAP
jgi:AcrR family transcriptional regulator